MDIDRRRFVVASTLACTMLPALARAAPPGEPILYRVRQGAGTAYLFGFFEAIDDSWFAPKIAAALDAANVLWLETPPGLATAAAEGKGGPPPDPALQKVFAEKAFDPAHDLFAVLPPALSSRTREWATKLALDPKSLAPMRPWMARIQFQQAYASQRQARSGEDEKLVFPEQVVIERARRHGIPVESEYPTLAHLIRFFADLPGAAQPQYLEELFDYFDRDAAGLNDETKYGWITGNPSIVSLNEQRDRMPDLYRAMHIERNAWWCGRIEGMLATGQTAFLMLGMNHTLGPDSIQANLERRGLLVERL